MKRERENTWDYFLFKKPSIFTMFRINNTAIAAGKINMNR
jgi:hypothetical protein